MSRMAAIVMMANFGAVFAALNAGMYIEASNFAYRAGNPAMYDGVVGMALAFLSMMGPVLCGLAIDD